MKEFEGVGPCRKPGNASKKVPANGIAGSTVRSGKVTEASCSSPANLGSRLKLNPEPSSPLSVRNVRSKSGKGLNVVDDSADSRRALRSSMSA